MLITAAEAAEVLGVEVQSVYNLVQRGRLHRHSGTYERRAYDLDEVEERSLRRLARRSGCRPHPYWASLGEAAAELGYAVQTVRNMASRGDLPTELAANGRRYIRRHQLQVIANAWEARAWADLRSDHLEGLGVRLVVVSDDGGAMPSRGG